MYRLFVVTTRLFVYRVSCDDYVCCFCVYECFCCVCVYCCEVFGKEMIECYVEDYF